MKKNSVLQAFILTFGVFGILNTETGMEGIFPGIASRFETGIAAGALAVIIGAPAGMNSNVNRYLIREAGPEASKFSNSLYLTSPVSDLAAILRKKNWKNGLPDYKHREVSAWYRKSN